MRLIRITRSSRPDKKYAAEFESDGGRVRVVHFGAAGYGDFISYSARSPSLAAEKRRAYIARHGAAERWDRPDTPASLSRYVLWESPSLESAVEGYRARFGV